MEVGELLRSARQRHGLSQDRLALRAGTTQEQVSRIERRQISPSLSMLQRLFAAMGEGLELTTIPTPGGNQSTSELRRAYELLDARERMVQGAHLSQLGTGMRRVE
jgi:transcriptional regulator with XRE-family HTH domain